MAACELTFKRWQHATSTAATDHEGPRNLLTIPLVIEGWSDPMKDANKLIPLLRNDDLIQVEKAPFIKTISQFGHRLEAQVKVNTN